MTQFHNEKFRDDVEKLFEAILTLENAEECHRFFEDICTIKELQEISQRWSVARMLDAGCNYQEVSKETGASTATISRVNKCLVYGSGGYKEILGKSGQGKSEK